MNKTITVNIGGYAFTIEEEAYNSLVSYLKTIESYFANEESGEEILQDIESRIAELFNERLADGRQVVDPADVDEIKTIMGEPEQYINDEEAEPSGSTSEETKEPKSKNRKFYRDVDEAMIGGVCAGLSHYLGWDPIWLRGICIILTLAGLAAVPVYLVLWILIPSANTTAEKLKMKGRSINVENISKSVKDEMEGIKNSIKDIGDKAGQESRRIRQKAVPKVVDSLGSVAKAFLK
ncbi:MAG: PspC domain-containing protein, partial [Bacteroidota bacterium]